MCKVYNPVGSLTSVKQQLARHKIDNFSSINELLVFLDSYESTKQQIIATCQAQLTEEKTKLNNEYCELKDEIARKTNEIEDKLNAALYKLRTEYEAISEIEKNIIQEFTYGFKALFLFIQIKFKEYTFHSTVSAALKGKVATLALMQERLQSITSNFDQELQRSMSQALYELDHKKKVIEDLKTTIYGAIGEQKVARELEQLSDDFILINDYSYYFEKSIPYRQENQYIRTIQVDHLLISPAGIFLIETKNWSKESLKNLSLRSPVNQIKRTNYALYKILSGNAALKLEGHHWGDRKIPIRNLIVMVNQKPNEEFEYVKVLTLNELLGYLRFFKRCLSKNEINNIADYLIRVGTPNFGAYTSRDPILSGVPVSGLYS